MSNFDVFFEVMWCACAHSARPRHTPLTKS